MDVKLYVGNLPFDATEQAIRDLFAQSGTVASVALIKDRDTGQSKGFAFVEMSSQKEAQAAISRLNGQNFGDRELKVNLARPREERPSFHSGAGRRDRGFGRGGRRK
jgi:RNA recognition motif-containing protein